MCFRLPSQSPISTSSGMQKLFYHKAKSLFYTFDSWRNGGFSRLSGAIYLFDPFKLWQVKSQLSQSRMIYFLKYKNFDFYCRFTVCHAILRSFRNSNFGIQADPLSLDPKTPRSHKMLTCLEAVVGTPNDRITNFVIAAFRRPEISPTRKVFDPSSRSLLTGSHC